MRSARAGRLAGPTARRGRERGSVAVAVIGVFVVGAVLVLGAARVGVALLARARAQTAADAAALAAADARALGASPVAACRDAVATAEANGARLTLCAWDATTVTATAVVDAPGLGRVARVRASAEVRGFVVPPP